MISPNNYQNIKDFVEYCKAEYKSWVIQRGYKLRAEDITEDLNRLEKIIKGDTIFKTNNSVTEDKDDRNRS